MQFNRTYWTYAAHSGRLPQTPAGDRIAPTGKPLALKLLGRFVTSPGVGEILDPQAVANAVERNTMRVSRPVLNQPPLQGQRIYSDAMGVPRSLYAPTTLGAIRMLQFEG